MLLWWNESLYCLEIMGWKNDNTVGKSKCGWTGDEPLCMCVLPVCMFQPCSILWPLWGLWSWWKTSGDSRPPLKGLWFWNSIVRASLYCASFRVHCATLLPIGNKSLNISWLYCWRICGSDDMVYGICFKILMVEEQMKQTDHDLRAFRAE